MNYHVEFTDVAEMETEAILLWINGQSPDRAGRWQEGLEQAVSSLSEFPRRCGLAPENSHFQAEIRQLLFGSYRILFTLLDLDGDGEEETVRILHVRHGARRPLGAEEAEGT
jgi:plasmid stabilization system protein ParE